MATPEGKIKDAIKAGLARLRAYWHMPVQNGMGAPALDFHVCVPIVITPEMVGQRFGLYVGVEAKAPGGKATPRQMATASRIIDAGGSVFVIDKDTGQLHEWALHPHPQAAPAAVHMYRAENGVSSEVNLNRPGDAEP